MADLDPVEESGANDGQAADGTLVVNADGEETRVYKRAARPYTPTRADWDSHLPLHLNYRDWCEDCVRAKALATKHMTQADAPLDGVKWNMDYCFMGDNLEDDLLDDESDEKKGRTSRLGGV